MVEVVSLGLAPMLRLVTTKNLAVNVWLLRSVMMLLSLPMGMARATDVLPPPENIPVPIRLLTVIRTMDPTLRRWETMEAVLRALHLGTGVGKLRLRMSFPHFVHL